MFTIHTAILNRILVYVDLAIIPLLAYIWQKKKKKNEILINSAILAGFAFIFIVNIYHMYGENTNLLLYRTVFK